MAMDPRVEVSAALAHAKAHYELWPGADLDELVRLSGTAQSVTDLPDWIQRAWTARDQSLPAADVQVVTQDEVDAVDPRMELADRLGPIVDDPVIYSPDPGPVDEVEVSDGVRSWAVPRDEAEELLQQVRQHRQG